jgi:para-nitrobenzyl esterase
MAPQLALHTTQGELLGRISTAVSGETARCYLNVPYAAPPVGALRFKAPQSPLPWTGASHSIGPGRVILNQLN